MKKLCFIFLLTVPLVVLVGCNTVSKNDNNANQNLQIERTGTVSNSQSLNILTNNFNDENNNTMPENGTQNTVQEPQPTEPPVNEPVKSEPVETVLAEFSTTIKSRASNRLNNIQITCSK